MGNGLRTLEQPSSVLAVECDEPDGKVVRHVRPCLLTVDKLRTIYQQIMKFDVLFNEDISTFAGFLSCFMYQTDDGELHPTGLMWEVDDVGILRLSDIKPGYEAKAHFTFWDRRFRGRARLLLIMTEYVFRKFGFHRIVVEVPLYAENTMNLVEGLGFVKEGRKRSAVRYKGEWFDMNMYAMLEDEVAEHRARIEGEA